ncbi:V-type ATP synthase subunit E [Ruminococcus sp.]|uniref:V-type ATP synthase subunit E n=1 Tax=Ruminococcus sp. TaxID=41978 RepID=UPI00386DB5E5
MNEKTKESKFLDAINKYAEQQKAQITQEIEDYKNTKIEQATEQGLQDAYDLIREDISRRKAVIVNDLAKKELALRNELFYERQTLADKVFDEARQKLVAFTKTDDYNRFLGRSLAEIKVKCGTARCDIAIAPTDEDKRGLIADVFPDARITADPHIQIGGVKANCPELGILMDDTLDSRLEEQRRWFIETCSMKVV